MAFRELTIDNFGGGFSQSDYEASLGQFKYAQDFDIYTDKKILSPNFEMSAAVNGLLTTSAYIRDFEQYGTNFYAIGNTAGSGNNALYKLTGVAANWQTAAVDVAGVGIGGMELYNGSLYFFQSVNAISRFDAVGQFSGAFKSGLSNLGGTPYAHAASDEIYFAAKNSVHSYDGTNWTEAAMTVPDNYDIIGFAPWNRWIVLGANAVQNSETSKFFLWDTYNIYPEQIIDLGNKYLKQIANVDGTIVGVCAPDDIRFIEWRGGSKVYRSRFLKTGNPSNERLSIGNPDIKDGRMYIPLGGATTFEQGIYTYIPHESTPSKAILTIDRAANNTALVNNSSTVITSVGWFDSGETDAAARLLMSYGFAGEDLDQVEKSGVNYSSAARWESILYEPFPGQESQVNRIEMISKPLPANCALSAFVKTDMEANWNYVDALSGTGVTKKKMWDINIGAFKIGTYHQFKVEAGINTTTRPELLKFIVKFRDAERR